MRTDASDLGTHLQATLADAYEFEHELGGGGMSRVFLAEEIALGRRVVVKVLAPDLTQEVSAERFTREIRIAARLQHPNILPVFAAGSAGGMLYYTMPFVEGESLRTRLERDGALPLPDALAILRDVARALAHAHERGVVHRDVKPDNVLLSRDAAVVADFGIAKAIDSSRTEGGGSVTLTQLGVAIGTPAYMAPEQAAGEAIDHHADLYAWGVLAYETLAGRHPFASRRTAQALIMAHLTEAPPPLDAARPGLSPLLVALVTRCLAKTPNERPASAREVVDLLGSLTTASAATTPGVAASSQPIPSIAVLPFVNLGANAEDEYFSDGITEEIRNILAHDRALHVAARGSSFAFKGKTLDPRAIAQELHVQTLVEGSVRRVASRVRITAQLVNAVDGFQLWSERFDRDLTDIFAVQDEIAAAIAATLRKALRGPLQTGLPNEARAGIDVQPGRRARQPPNLEAYDEYLRGRYLNYRLSEGHRAAITHFQRALSLDPTFAPALAGMAEVNLWLAISMVLPPAEAFTRTRRYAQEALAIDPELAYAHYLLGEIAYWHEWDPDACARHIKRGLALEPNNAETLQLSARLHLIRGRIREALEDCDAAISADPVSPGTKWHAIVIAFCAGAFERAAATADSVLTEDPSYLDALRWRGKARCMMGDVDRGLADLERAAAAGHPLIFLSAEIASALCAKGRVDEAQRIRDDLVDRSARGWIPPCAIAWVEHALGNRDTAFRWLERALETRDFLCVALQFDALFLRAVSPKHSRPITDDSRWGEFVRRVGMAPSSPAS